MKRAADSRQAKSEPLARYREMRDFAATPEPSGTGAVKTGGEPSFTVQRHDARRLHYDFRLELGGVLKSWAVPKGPSLDPSEKRLAVETEDHPLDYGDFEGVIPPKHYGAGQVVLWDRGRWSTDDPDPAAALAKGKLKFRLDGEKLHGGWTLVRMRSRDEEAPDAPANWLLIKEHDEAARTGPEAEITEAQPGSVKHRRERTAPKAAEAAPSPKPAARRVRNEPAEPGKPSRTPPAGAEEGDLPPFFAPQLATLVSAAPPGESWVYEIKYDGYRMLARLDAGKVTLYTRNGHDWTGRMPRLAKALAALAFDGSWLDGEIVVNGDDGLPDFQALQNAFDQESTSEIVYYVFDAPWLRGRDLGGEPLAERKRLLAEALEGHTRGVIAFSEHFTGPVDEALAQACRLGLEGLIGKRADARYVPGRSRSWIKLKCRPRQEFVIGGYSDPAGARTGFGALLVGLYDDGGQLNYAGKVGTGFDQSMLKALSARLAKLERDTAPFHRPPRATGLHWVTPTLVAEIEYAGWTREGLLRQAAFGGLREDKPARTIRDETPLRPAEAERAADAESAAERATAQAGDRAKPTKATAVGTTRAKSAGGTVRVAGVVISHPERVVWPGYDLTKADLARYYEAVADWLMPHIANRPLSLLRCPDGSAAECFFQRHMGQERPKGVEDFLWEGSRPSQRRYLYVTNLEGVVGMVQRGAIEFHTWGSTMPRADRPDRFTIDLDPAPEVPWERVVEAARLVHGLLAEIGLASFLKTTGGKGLHVVVPLRRGPAWEDVKRFTKAVASHLATTLPDRFTTNMSKEKRVGRIFIDYLRNDASATAICAYSARARPGAPVSMPLAWDELGPSLAAAGFTIVTAPKRLAALRQDPWHDYAAKRFTLTRGMWEALGQSPP